MIKWKSILLLIILPVFITGIWVICIHTPGYAIYPNERFVPYAYTDKENGVPTCSKIVVLDTINQIIRLKYELHNDTSVFPYAGIGLYFPYPIDFSRYTYMEVNLKINRSRSVICDIRNYFIHPLTDDSTGRLYRLELPKSENDIYRFKINSFKSPAWWFSGQNLNEKEAGGGDLSQIEQLQFGTGYNFIYGERNSFIVKSISLIKDNTHNYFIILGIIVLYYLSCFLLKRFRENHTSKEIPYQELIVVENNENDKVFELINEKYIEPDFSLEDIQQELALTPYKISQILKDGYDMTFKQYLNYIRINEAKKLLNETDLPIMDIAYKVGYNSITHFNRVFKSLTEQSPKIFRGK